MNTKITIFLFNANMAADWIGLSTSTLAKLRLSGQGPAYSKLGRRVVYAINDLEAWVTERRYKSTSEYGTKGS
jgi:helix-turn-helix protein